MESKPTMNHDNIIANQLAGMSLEEAIFQHGYSSGYERGKREATAPRWVKAVEFKFEEGSEYFYKYEYMEKNFKGVAKFEDGMLWATEKTVLPIGYSELYILDEQPAAGREEDAVLGILQYISESEFYYNHAEKAWLIKGTHSIKLTHNELIEKYELFKQQKV